MDIAVMEASQPGFAAVASPRMEEDVHILVLVPYRDIVEKAKLAIENAEEADPPLPEMRKAAQRLCKEGERALKRIQPLCKKHLEEYGQNFVNALKENDDIATFRAELNDLLWDFDSYIEVDEFDADEFTKLHALSRKSAPRIYDILMRMKLEHPQVIPNYASTAASRAASVAGFSEGHPTHHEAEGALHEQDVSADEQTRPTSLAGIQGGPDLGLDGDQPPERNSHETPNDRPSEPGLLADQLRSADSVRPEGIPPEPPDNPWQLEQRLAVEPGEGEEAKVEEEENDDDDDDDAAAVERRRRVSFASDGLEAGSPVALLPVASRSDLQRPQSLSLDEIVGDGAEGSNHAARHNSTASPIELRSVNYGQSSNHPAPVSELGDAQSPYMTAQSPSIMGQSPYMTGQCPSITGMSPYMTGSETAPSLAAIPFANELPPAAPGVQRYSHASSTSSAHPSLFDAGGRDSAASFAHSPPNAGPHPFHSVPEDQPDVSGAWPLPDPQLPLPLPSSSRASIDQPGLEPVHMSSEEGLIPVSGEVLSSRSGLSRMQTKESDCTINIDSSFYRFKGFCDGAKEVIRGGAGVKRIRKPGMGAGTAVVAKCKSCMFELDWNLVEADVNMTADANYFKTGIGFRLRFLSKSHIPAKHIDDQLYGCLFCTQLGRTTEESDATVFFTQRQLFSHLTRHPRPFPAVPGVTVVDSSTIPRPLRNNYDLHFLNPPAKSVMVGLERLVAGMPTAIATDTFRQSNNTLRHPPDHEPVLQFAAGARIVGIEFPGRYGGEWGIGWADNVRAAFPIDCVKFMPPDQSQIRMQARSNLRAVARWKRSPKDKDSQWLKFDKGEAITGIGFPSAEHWCWSGYNSKGKWGIFPQSHMEPNTLSVAIPERPSRANTSGDRASIHSHESRRGSGLLARFSSIRHRDGRPPSSVDSGSSGETAGQRSPRP